MQPGRGLLLALDQGGHASRALVLDARGVVIARAEVEVATRAPAPDVVEHDADELAGSLAAAASEVVRGLGPRAAELACAGLACQRSTIVCWDRETGAALSPAISWQDRRAAHWLAQFAGKSVHIRRITGLPLSPHYGASKLRWCLDHLPAVAQAAQQQRLAMGPLASFLLYRLLRERPLVVDPANAARTLLWNLATLDWDPELIRIFGLPGAALPRCVPTRHAFGTIELADRIMPLTVSNGDQQAALYAHGDPPADGALVNLGTGAFILHTLEAPPRDASQLLVSVAAQESGRTTWLLEGTVNGAGSALAWIARATGLAHPESGLDAWFGEVAEPPLFLNGVAGLGSPWWRADFPSRFLAAADPRAQVVAVAESIVFLVQSNLEQMSAEGATIARLTVTGGLSAVDGLCRRLADLSGLPVWRPAETEASARGLAWFLAGGPAEWPESTAGVSFVPQPNAALAARYARWREAMDAALAEA